MAMDTIKLKFVSNCQAFAHCMDNKTKALDLESIILENVFLWQCSYDICCLIFLQPCFFP